MFIGVKLDLKSWIYYNSRTNPMDQSTIGQRIKLSIIYKAEVFIGASGSPSNGLTGP